MALKFLILQKTQIYSSFTDMMTEVASLPTTTSDANISLDLSSFEDPSVSMGIVDVIEEVEEDPDTLDLSGKGLQKLSRAAKEWALNSTTLLLDNNALQRLDNIHTYECIEKVRQI